MDVYSIEINNNGDIARDWANLNEYQCNHIYCRDVVAMTCLLHKNRFPNTSSQAHVLRSKIKPAFDQFFSAKKIAGDVRQ